MRYAVYGHVLDSAVALPELPTAPDRDADITITLGRTSGAGRAIARVAAGRLTVRRARDGFTLRIGREALFSVSADARRIAVHRDERGLTDTVRHLLLDQVTPLALAHRGSLVLHGSAVGLAGGAIGFVGPSGAGKSTLAASWARLGGSLVADDALVVQIASGSPVAHPAYPSVRVWPDVLPALGAGAPTAVASDDSTKQRVRITERFASGPLPLARLYLLDPDESPNICLRALARRQAAVALLANSYVLDARDRDRLAGQLLDACDLIDVVDVRSLRYPRALGRLPDVRAAILADLTG